MKRVIFMIVFTIFLVGCSNSEVPTESAYGNTIQNFALLNQYEEEFKQKEMEGKVWLVDFIFTNCKTVCPPMTANMTEVVQELDERGVEDFGILSFSVDPKNDTPEVMRNYLSYYEIPEGVEWQFVSGYDEKYIRTFAEKNFRTLVAPPPEGSDQVTHSISFYLVDKDGTIKKDYAGVDRGETSFPLEEIVSDVETLASAENE